MYNRQDRKGESPAFGAHRSHFFDLELKASRAAGEREAPAGISGTARALQSRLQALRSVGACKEARRRGVEVKLMWRGSRMYAKWLIADGGGHGQRGAQRRCALGLGVGAGEVMLCCCICVAWGV